jgi:hypothetical protein
MKIVLFGPPDCGKRKFANSLKRKYPNFSVSSNSEDVIKAFFKKEELTPTLGLLCDYRTELMLAGIRASDVLDKSDKIYVNSLLDNLLHSIIISSIKINNEAITEEYIQCMTFFPALIRDSLDCDLVIVFEKELDGQDDEIIEVFNQNVKFLANTFKIKILSSKNKKEIYTEIDKLIKQNNDTRPTTNQTKSN